jgi:hypothetical protein
MTTDADDDDEKASDTAQKSPRASRRDLRTRVRKD